MAVLEVRVLPPVAVGRLGSSATPLEAFDLVVPDDRPLDYRTIDPRESFRVDPDSGELTAYTPDNIRFRDGDRIRPVAPFLEVFAVTDAAPDRLVPLTAALLAEHGLSLSAASWTVEVANIKIHRRTGDDGDKITVCVPDIKDHASHDLLGSCDHFVGKKKLPLGSVRFIRPTEAHPGLRLRFTPAEGKVYGSSLERHTSKTAVEKDPVILSADQILYDPKKGKWRGWKESSGPALTNPAQIFAGYADGPYQVSWGYLDDECDGHVEFRLDLGKGKVLAARAVIGAGPPAFAPDTLPVRVVSDELEQLLLGPEVAGEVPIEEAEEIVRRALETVRLMNTAVMNGNPVNGRQNIASTMVRQDTNDFGRLYEPIMAASIVDNLAVLALHERVFNALNSGAAPWFSEVLRRPDEIGDLSSEGRRKMPAMMRNADGRALCLTHRQINTVIRAAAGAMFRAAGSARAAAPGLEPGNLAVQVHYRGAGNPFSVLPRTAISNCFPGLEYDFRNLWRRALVGLVMLENNNYVVAAEDPKLAHLVGHRLVRVDGKSTTVATSGPVFPGGDSGPLATTSNPNGVSFMEWSNSLAAVLQKAGEVVECEFVKAPNDAEVVWDAKTPTVKAKLKVRELFAGDSAAIAAGVLNPGELTQGLCAPWQNDYRECACYYWAASRPDYVNVQPGPDGLSHGDQWMAKARTGEYIPDDRKDTRLVTYDDLFRDWQKELRFIIKGKDADQS